MKTCSVEGCNNKHYGKGLCQKHHRRWWRAQNPGHDTEIAKQWRKKNRLKCRIASAKCRDKQKSGVYRLVWSDGSVYFGSSKFLSDRKKCHETKFAKGTCLSRYLQRLYDSGLTYQFEILAYCDRENIHYYEDLLIANLPCVNMQLSDSTPK